MVIGGYSFKERRLIEGSDYIEIFSIKKWEIDLNPLVIKLSIGRISPIVFPCDHEGESSVYIIGGKSNAKCNEHISKLIFDKDQDDLNNTTNQTGVRFKSSMIDSWFQNEENNIFMVNNLNVRFENRLKLYNGCVLLRKSKKGEKLELFLSGEKPLYNIKVIKNDLHIIESQFFLTRPGNSKEQIRLSIGNNKFEDKQSPFCRVDSKGKLELFPIESDLSQLTTCCIM